MDTLSKIYEAKSNGHKIGFTCSCFDLLHAGHIAMLAEAKQKCSFLVVGLLADPTEDRPSKNKPVQSLFERWTQLQAVSYVDVIIPFSKEQDIVDILTVINPDIRIVGEEYRGRDYTGHTLPIDTWFNKRNHSFSSSDLRKRVVDGS